MKITGVVSEFNPFHKGHEYLLRTLRENVADLIICVMSGSFVQRGEPAIADKYSRAAMAVSCGADIVVELPFPYSSASAEYFASAGITVLDSMGINALGFGSECGNIELLQETAKTITQEKFIEYYRQRCRDGKGATAAYLDTFKEIAGENMPADSNDILGIEYIKAAKKSGVNINFETIKREGSGYNSNGIDSNMPSAKALRNLIYSSGIESVKQYMPEKAYIKLYEAVQKGCAPTNIKNAERALLAYLRLVKPKNLRDVAECSDGLGDRLHKVSLESVSYEELLEKASAKNYTDTRLRRAVLFSMTDVKKVDLKRTPAYTLLLAASRQGSDYLAKNRCKTKIPVITKPADVRALGEIAARQKELSDKADAIWTIMLASPAPAGELIRRRPIIV